MYNSFFSTQKNSQAAQIQFSQCVSCWLLPQYNHIFVLGRRGRGILIACETHTHKKFSEMRDKGEVPDMSVIFCCSPVYKTEKVVADHTSTATETEKPEIHCSGENQSTFFFLQVEYLLGRRDIPYFQN